MSGAGTMAGRAENQSQRDSDVGWFLERAQQAANRIEDPWERATEHTAIALAHVAAGNRAAFWEAVDLAHGAAAAVEPAGAGASLSYFLHEFIAEGQVRIGNVAGAMNRAAGIQDPVCRARAYCTIAHAQATAGNEAAAREAIKLAKEAAAREASGASDAAYLSISHAQASVGDVAAALSTVGHIVHSRFIALWQIAYTHAEAGNTSACLEAIELAKQEAAVYEDPPLKVWASAMITRAQAHAGDFAGSMRTAAGIATPEAKVGAYCYIAEQQGEVGGIGAGKAALQLAKEAAKAITEPSSKVRAHHAIAKAKVQTADLAGPKERIPLAEEATAGVGKAPDGELPNWYIAEVQAKAGDFAGAMQTTAGIDEPWRKANAYGEIAQAQARTGGAEAVKAWIEKLTDPQEVVDACLGAVRGLLGEED